MFPLKDVLFAILFFSFAFIKSGLGLKQAFFHKKAGQYLPDSVITTKYAESELECSMWCKIHKECLSVNYIVKGLDQGLCQLNNNTISENVGVTNDRFVYLAIAAWSKTKPQEIVSKSSCKELFDDDGSLKNGVYHLISNVSSEKYPVYCHMTEFPGCGTGGWTLVMKTNGNLSTFTYDSPLWTNKESYAVEDGLEGLTEKERKLASYWNTPFKKICLGMTVNSDSRWMMLDYEASSLYSLIADGQYRSTSAGRPAWKSLIASSSLQPNCNKEGFSIAHDQHKVRIGYYTNNQNSCSYADSCIGFGIAYTSCSITSHITCGNIAKCSQTDNGDKLTAAFGYIFVQ